AQLSDTSRTSEWPRFSPFCPPPSSCCQPANAASSADFWPSAHSWLSPTSSCWSSSTSRTTPESWVSTGEYHELEPANRGLLTTVVKSPACRAAAQRRLLYSRF